MFEAHHSALASIATELNVLKDKQNGLRGENSQPNLTAFQVLID